MTFREFAIDTAYRCGWTFVQALLSSMTIGQSVSDLDWKGSTLIALVAVVIVLLKQTGKWCFAHIKDTSDLQTTFNDDSYIDMKGVPHYEDTDISAEQ